MTTLLSATSIVPNIPVADLRQIVAALQAAHPAAGSRVEKGAMVFLFRHVERSESGAWYVQSETDAEVEYILAGDQCTCVDFQRHGDQSPCKHQFCRAITQRAERLEAERGTPAETLIDVDGEPIPYSITAEALAILDEQRQRDAARCPECNTWKQHGSLYCGGERCEAPPRWVPAIIA